MSQVLSVIMWNSCLATGLAGVVFLAQRMRLLRNQPLLRHALWLLVLVKLITPPLVAVPISVGSAEWLQTSDEGTTFNPTATSGGALPATFPEVAQSEVSRWQKLWSAILTPAVALVFSGLGSLVIAAVVLRRVRLISRLIDHTETGADSVQQETNRAAAQWEMRHVPAIRIVDGRVSPFLWVSMRQAFIVLPRELVASLSLPALRLIIRHELAHYRRRDHLSNAFTTLCVALFWWNPVVWWARRNLRMVQEECCDELVLAHDSSQRIQYAETLLQAVSFAGTDGTQCPSPATSFGSCDTLKRRIEMIVSGNVSPVRKWRGRLLIFAAALAVLPIGMTAAQDYKSVERRLGRAVKKGEISTEQAKVMMEALRRSTAGDGEAQKLREGVATRIAQIKKLVASGEMSYDEGTRLIEETRRPLEASAKKTAEGELAKKKQRYNAISREIKAAVEAGKLTKEEAEKKLVAVRKEMFDTPASEDSELDKKRAAIKYRMREIETLIKEGKLSREEGGELLRETKQALEKFNAGHAESSERAQAIEYRVREIKELIESGKLSREEGALLIRETRGDRTDEDPAVTVLRMKRFAEMQRKIKAAVDAGELSAEDAEKKLIILRKEISQD
jgi:beta-lactamase regulating signal transducer with metallopeptidase domain/polyhydroxyalkanoate synthesis regulator phasin